MSFHDLMPLGSIHKAVNWVYTDAAARLAAVGFVAEDYLKEALQWDNGSKWLLESHSPITWKQVGGGSAIWGGITGNLANQTDVSNAINAKESTANKNVANGYCGLGADTKVPAIYLPSYVDDVVEVANYAALPGTGEPGKIYVTIDDNRTYRWSGTVYVEVSSSLALGETSATAYRGDRGKTAYDHSQATGNAHSTSLSDLGIAGVTAGAQLLRGSNDYAAITTKSTLTGTEKVLIEDTADSNNKKVVTTQAIANLAAASSVWPIYTFQPKDFLNPNSSGGWAVSGLANIAQDPTNIAVPVRAHDDTLVEGVGFEVMVPTGATNLILRFKSRANTAPAGSRLVALGLYHKGMPDGAAIAAWSAVNNIRNIIEIGTNNNVLYDTYTGALATLGITADRLYLFELVRVGSDVTYDNLSGDWYLYHLEVTFS